MVNIEKTVKITAEIDKRFISMMVDTLSKKAASSIYITKDNSRQIAMKSVIGLLSGGFKAGDEVKLTAIGDGEDVVNRDLKLVEEMLKGEYD
ncbi:MAG: HPr family phosphocarrier protein [Oscillospiraceae bacterium]|nr:HPr family phosphocarrier protein [Oscillospiraceae bacterium]